MSELAPPSTPLAPHQPPAPLLAPPSGEGLTVAPPPESDQTPLQTRTEHSRSLEQADIYRALHTLDEIGYTVPISSMHVYHGRAAAAGEKAGWSVDPYFQNGGNDSGKGNVNARPTLYTSDKETAVDFARERKFEDARFAAWERYAEIIEANERAGDIRQANHDRMYKGATTCMVRKVDPDTGKSHYEPGPVPVVDTVSDWHEGEAYKEARRRMNDTEHPDEMAHHVFESVVNEITPQTYRILTEDTEARILDLTFDLDALSSDEARQLKDALKQLRLHPLEGSPVSFEHRDSTHSVMRALKNAKAPEERFFTETVVNDVAAEAGVEPALVRQIAGSINAWRQFPTNAGYLLKKLQENREDVFTDSVSIDGQTVDYPLTLEYVERTFRKAHIVGAKHRVNSMTVGGDITVTSFFDLERMKAPSQLHTRRDNVTRLLGGLAAEITAEVPESDLQRVLFEDPHSKPEQIVELAAAVPGYESVFAADAGNWEGYTLGQHTESVLRNFDESFADAVPVELIGTTRLALLVHDIGKGMAVAEGKKTHEKEYNAEAAHDFMNTVRVDDTTQRLVLALIGEGTDLAYRRHIRGQDTTSEFAAFAEKLFTDINYRDGTFNSSDIDGLALLCEIMLSCDGGAYTSAATTRVSNANVYRNAPSFNRSFQAAPDPGGRITRLRPNKTTPPMTSGQIVGEGPPSRLRKSSNGNKASRFREF